MSLAVSHQRNRLAYTQESFDFNIWRLKVADPHDRTSPAGRNGAPFIVSTRLELGPRFSPDGKRIAFVSGRSSRTGSSEIWVCDSEGSNQVQVTSVGADAANPSWSPDSERIAFDSTAEGNLAIYVISANGGKPLRLTRDSADNSEPSWSARREVDLFRVKSQRKRSDLEDARAGRSTCPGDQKRRHSLASNPRTANFSITPRVAENEPAFGESL